MQRPAKVKDPEEILAFGVFLPFYNYICRLPIK